jgi:hypothetical protein
MDLIECMRSEGLRLDDEYLYRPVHAIVLGKAYDTHAYEPVCSVEEFVTRHRGCKDRWTESCILSEGASLNKDRHVFAFRNGVYVASRDKFYPFKATVHIPASLVAAKYFDVEMLVPQAGTQCQNIPTPHLDQVLQGLPNRAQRWLRMLIGRLIYDVGELDNWSVIPLLLGGGEAASLVVCVCETYIGKPFGTRVVPQFTTEVAKPLTQ